MKKSILILLGGMLLGLSSPPGHAGQICYQVCSSQAGGPQRQQERMYASTFQVTARRRKSFECFGLERNYFILAGNAD